MENNEIRNMQSDFERTKHLTEKGIESWTSRKLCSAMGYSTNQKFGRVLNKAIDDMLSI